MNPNHRLLKLLLLQRHTLLLLVPSPTHLSHIILLSLQPLYMTSLHSCIIIIAHISIIVSNITIIIIIITLSTIPVLKQEILLNISSIKSNKTPLRLCKFILIRSWLINLRCHQINRKFIRIIAISIHKNTRNPKTVITTLTYPQNHLIHSIIQ